MTRRAFRRLVQDILRELPPEFSRALANVEFLVEDRPSRKMQEDFDVDDDTLLYGFYQGVPLPERSPTSYSGALPDRIILFQEAIEAEAGRPSRVVKVLKATILHELAHYFGIDDDRLHELKAY